MTKKVITTLTAFVALLLLLAACGNGSAPATPPGGGAAQTLETEPPQGQNDSEQNGTDTTEQNQADAQGQQEPEASNERMLAMRGTWEGYIYTNETLGLRFVKPEGWAEATDAEIADLMGLAADALDEPQFFDNVDVLIDMMATNIFTGANVQVTFERLSFPFTRISELDYIALTAQQMEQIGIDVNLDFPGTTRIGGYDWYSYGTAMDIMGITAYGRQFINVQDGFARIIIITYFDASESPEEILSLFIGLNDPIPEQTGAGRPQVADLEHAPELVGTWEWDYDDSFAYVFYADGRGTRGFTGHAEEFEWRTEGDDHLIIGSGALAEHWTFAISGDMLTIDSRQVAGMTFSYIRS